MMIKKLFIIAPLSLYIMGCSAPGVKAKDANLFQAMVNNSSGESENQIKVAAMKRDQTRKELSRELERSKNLELMLESTKLEKRKIDQQLQLAQQDNNKLENEIRSKKSQTKEQEITKQRRLIQIHKIKVSLASLNKSKRQMPSNKYKKKVDTLQKEIEILRRVMANQ